MNYILLQASASVSSGLTLFTKVFEYSFLLPSSKLRGFESGKIGPKDGTDYVGGNYAAAINVATTLPQALPNLQNTNLSVFFDAGNIWGVDYNSALADENAFNSLASNE